MKQLKFQIWCEEHQTPVEAATRYQPDLTWIGSTFMLEANVNKEEFCCPGLIDEFDAHKLPGMSFEQFVGEDSSCDDSWRIIPLAET